VQESCQQHVWHLKAKFRQSWPAELTNAATLRETVPLECCDVLCLMLPFSSTASSSTEQHRTANNRLCSFELAAFVNSSAFSCGPGL
jgi:hypothetical protein